MKKCLVLLAALLLFLPCAALAGGNSPVNADEERVVYFEAHEPEATPPSAMETMPPETTEYPCTAVANAASGGTVPLYQKPDARSAVLMNYYRGARITVLRAATPGFVMVQTGTKEAGLMGYMRRSDLAFGSAALREITPEFVMIRLNRETAIYSSCDAQSPQIGTCTTEEKYYTVGKNDDKWVQLTAPVGMYIESADEPLMTDQVASGEGEPFGFVHLETGMARGYEATAWRWEVEPAPGEITDLQAVELAIWWMMNAEGEIPPELRDESVLRLLPYDVERMCSPPGLGYIELSITVSYECDAYWFSVGLYPDGEIRYGHYEAAAKGS